MFILYYFTDSSDTKNQLLDLSLKKLKKIPKLDDAYRYHTLTLDGNELKSIEGIGLFYNIEKLSVYKNQLLRMNELCCLILLKELNLSYNSIFKIEGLRELTHLKNLNLAGNKLKNIENLEGNIGLEYLNLSENIIDLVSDISFLTCLKELYLHGNQLKHLSQCDKFLPPCLETLTLDKNLISDLNEMCSLSDLRNLVNLTINNNPCVEMNVFSNAFDHRPFVLNWCSTLKTIDDIIVDPLENLKAEWLYSQGRGRQFRIGEQENLRKYLQSVCPMFGKAGENENERKLRLILSKAQFHQRQLQKEIFINPNKYGVDTALHVEPKLEKRVFLSDERIESSSFMSNSFPGPSCSVPSTSSCNLISTSPQCSRMVTSLIDNGYSDSLNCMRMGTPAKLRSGEPLTAASKMVPVPEHLMSPDVCPSSTHILKGSTMNALPNIMNNISALLSVKHGNSNLLNHNRCESNNVLLKAEPFRFESQKELECGPIVIDETVDDIIAEKLATIKTKAAKRNQNQEEKSLAVHFGINHLSNSSAIKIQKFWRGFIARKKTKHLADNLTKHRTQEYIRKLAKDIKATNLQLERDRKSQQLQLQAINVLWRKVLTIQNASTLLENISSSSLKNTKFIAPDTSSAAVTELTQTCSILATQVKRLQGSISDVFDCLALFCSIITNNIRNELGFEEKNKSLGTQTEAALDNECRSEKKSVCPCKIRPSTLTLNNDEILNNSCSITLPQDRTGSDGKRI